MQVLALHVRCSDRVQKWVEAVFVDSGYEDELMNGTISDRMREFAAAPHAVRSAAG